MSEKKEELVFKLDKVNIEVPRGKLLAIVGPVGAGKSSLLQGMIGEMEGTVRFGGSIVYCAQNAWIQVGRLFWRLLRSHMAVRMRRFGRMFALGDLSRKRR
jgi:ABC-type Mn2+/Zn2+ transport system ATPase subunit